MTQFASFLGFAAKAGQLIAGSAAVEAALKKNQLKMVICAADLSEKTIKNFHYLAQSNQVDFYVVASIAEISNWIGKPGRGVIGILTDQFAAPLRRVLTANEWKRGE